MRLSTILAPTAEPVSLSEAKAHLRAEDADDDALIEAQVAAARRYVEDYTKQILVGRTLRADLDCFPGGVIELPVGPVREVASIVYLDSSGDSQTLATTLWQSDLRGRLARLLWDAGDAPWPNTEIGRLNAVTVTFTAGQAIPFTTTNATDTIDAVAHPFADGDTFQVWNSGGELPGGLAAQTNYYVITAAADSFQLSLTSGGSAVALSDDGSGTHFAGLIDQPIRAALLLLLGALYENREDEITGTITTRLKVGLDRLLLPYTEMRF